MNKLPVKILFVDIDWTIFDHEIKDFDFESLTELKQAQKKGILVYLATARPYHSVEQLKLFEHFTPDGIITSNGSVIFAKDKMIYGKEIPHDIANKVCNYAVKHHLNVEVTTPKDRFVISKNFKRVEELYETFYDFLPEYRKIKDDKVMTMLFFGEEKYDKDIIKILPKDMYRFRFSDKGMDISFSPTEKGNAIKLVLKHHKLSKDQAMSFGDSNLDVSMFKATKYSVAMGNANDDVKKEATYVAESISNHGVKKIIKKLL